MDPEFEPKELVRRFSEQVRDKLQESGSQDDHELERCLTETLEARDSKRRAQIEKIYNYQRSSSDEERLNLKHSRHALEAALESFGQTVSKDQKNTLAVKISSWQDVKATIERVQASWEQKRDNSKFRRGAEYLRSICNTIDSHSAVLEMLPSSNDYASVLCGGLTTVVKASANYTNIVETLPRALLEINNIVAAVEREIRIFEAPSTKSLTWRMYGRIFTLLTHVVEWYTQRWSQRLLRSFNENLAEFFETQLRQIRQDSDFIRRDISLQAHTDARLSRLYNESLDDKISFMMTLEARDRRARESMRYRYQDFKELMDAEQRKSLENTGKQQDILAIVWTGVRTRYTGDAMSEILEGRVQNLPVGSAATVVSEEDDVSSFITSSSTSHQNTSSDKEEERVEAVSTRELVLLSSARLEDFFDRDKVQQYLDFPASFYVPSDISIVSYRMTHFLAYPESMLLLPGKPDFRLCPTLAYCLTRHHKKTGGQEKPWS
ncbi:Phytanoyl-dioxygenase family protein [Lasiodiplodia theobromae]|uniref:Phytanoyl-dioxygenase family protein n=1 Tax=Lasiodiplodia theobromae TaxID=45133 RepID=UPI0015C31277|nr:Phytanoyl-dioxygenase family protein [Lasiodiplodia theobromae]KAF4536168.1 Phytanoyl-dioxygenase family protein [Lasiodiplodia theobromae]